MHSSSKPAAGTLVPATPYKHVTYTQTDYKSNI